MVIGQDTSVIQSIIFPHSIRSMANDQNGLIFIESEKPYELTTSYKWKPLRDTTIDFLVKKAPKELYGVNPYIEREGYQMYILFVTTALGIYLLVKVHCVLCGHQWGESVVAHEACCILPMECRASQTLLDCPLAYYASPHPNYHSCTSDLGLDNTKRIHNATVGKRGWREVANSELQARDGDGGARVWV
jgi:hypothetical protein